jgi:MtrB/PioB family decaheme-associated outer membrane protein
MKKFTRKFGFSISALLPVMLLSAQGTTALAQDTDPKIYSCKQCVKYTGWRGIVDFGLGWVSTDSPHFGDYRGLDEKGFYAAIDGDIHYRNLQGLYFDMYADNLGYDSREIDLRAGNQGVFEVRFGWQEIPKYRGFGTETPFIGQGGDYLTLPDDWVRANTTSGMTALDDSLAIAKLKTKRKILDAGFTLDFARNWSYTIDYQRQDKKGTRPFGADMYYSNASILPAPVDFTTDLVDMDLSWSGKRAQVQMAFSSSVFNNGNSSLTWDNPFKSNPAQDILRSALEPDNKFHQFSLSGAYAFTPKIRLSGKAAWGRMKQNDYFLPYTINPLYSDLPLPRSSLDGRVDTSTYNLTGKLYARLNNRLSFTARGKWDERDNKTPVDIYTPVVTDLVVSAPRYNRPYSYKRQLYSADLRYRFNRTVRLSGGARYELMDRTLQAVERTDETTWWGQVKVDPTLNTQLRVKLETADRDIDDYLQPDDGGPVDHPLMRKFNMADRDRDRMLIEYDYMPTESFGINLAFIQANSKYDESVIGLQKSDDKSYSINLNYVTASNISLYGFYNYDNIYAKIDNTVGGSSEPWTSKTRDKIKTWGLGLSTPINEKSSIGLDLVSSKANGDIATRTAADEDPFPTLKTHLRNAKLHYDRQINDRWGYKVYAEFEKYRSSNWAVDGLGVDGINSVLSMGEYSPALNNVWYIRVQASYTF